MSDPGARASFVTGPSALRAALVQRSCAASGLSKIPWVHVASLLLLLVTAFVSSCGGRSQQYSIAWERNGTLLVSGSDLGLVRCSASGDVLERLLAPQWDIDGLAVADSELGPVIAFSARKGGPKVANGEVASEVYFLRVGSKAPERVTTNSTADKVLVGDVGPSVWVQTYSAAPPSLLMSAWIPQGVRRIRLFTGKPEVIVHARAPGTDLVAGGRHQELGVILCDRWPMGEGSLVLDYDGRVQMSHCSWLEVTPAGSVGVDAFREAGRSGEAVVFQRSGSNQKLSIQRFYDHRVPYAPRVSPDGEHIAWIVKDAQYSERDHQLWIADLVAETTRAVPLGSSFLR